MVINIINQDMTATAETMGVKRTISLRLVPDAKPGDHVLVHAGFAIEKMDSAEAAETISLLESMLKERP